MTDNERVLCREIDKLEGIISDLRRKLQIAEQFNFKYYRQNQELSYYIQQMEKHGDGLYI